MVTFIYQYCFNNIMFISSYKEKHRRYYLTKIKPFKKQGKFLLRYRCVICNNLSFPDRFNNDTYLFQPDVMVQYGSKFQDAFIVNPTFAVVWQNEHLEAIGKRCVKFLKHIWSDDRIVNEFKLFFPKNDIKINLDFSYSSSEFKVNSFFNLVDIKQKTDYKPIMEVKVYG